MRLTPQVKLVAIVLLIIVLIVCNFAFSSSGNYWDGKENVTVAITGDVMLGRDVPDIIASGSLFGDVPSLSGANLTIYNLECAITDSNNSVKSDMPMSAPTSVIGAIKASNGATLVAQANNHGFDYGVDGMHDGITAIEGAGISHIGVGDNSDEAYEPFVYEVGGRKITVLNYMDSRNFADYSQEELPIAGENTPGYAAYSQSKMEEQVKEAHNQGSDFVLVFYHNGHCGESVPDENQTDMAYAAINAGADTVVATHTHLAQGVEVFNGKPIFYSMSDFIFDYSADGSAYGYFITFDLTGGECVATLHPYVISGAIPHELDADAGKEFFSGLTPSCDEMTINSDGTGTIVFNLTAPK